MESMLLLEQNGYHDHDYSNNNNNNYNNNSNNNNSNNDDSDSNNNNSEISTYIDDDLLAIGGLSIMRIDEAMR